MTADARSLGVNVPDSFDFDSQAGMLFVLRAIRAADIKNQDKNTLKDLVFLYNTSGKDEAVKKKLEATLAQLGVTPEAVLLAESKETGASETEVNVVPVVETGFMSGRLTPVFNTNTSAVIKQSAPAPKNENQAQPTEIVEEKSLPKNVVEAPVEKITPVAPLIRPTVPVPTLTPVETEANNIELSKKVAVATQVENRSVPVPDYVSARMERIRVIKSDVNAKVGNPVNLVDVDNTLGREYMGALLDAMKLLSSASEQESMAAMNRLESVYKRVQELLDSKAEPTPSSPVVSTPVAPQAEPVSTPPPVINVKNEPEIVAPVAPLVQPTIVEPLSVPVTMQAVPKENEFAIRSKVTEKPRVETTVSNWDSPAASSEAKMVEVIPSVAKTVTPPDNFTVARMSTPPAEPLRPVVSPVASSYQPEVTPSVSEVEPLRAITELPTADEVSAIESMSNNPLYTKDVDAGLDQLLSEWAIFKKSGLFGTGPKGREHPLYVKIASMQVPLILSGRFEGSSQEIKQSITDYMNGWRYEQGIIYEANETFEQYLRRVIRHIIDLQKTKRRS